MKKLSILAAAALLTLSAVPALSACEIDLGINNKKPSGEDSALWEPFENVELTGDEVLVKAHGSEGRIRWAEQSKAEGYVLYRSESRFGQYEEVARVKANTLSYSTRENIYDYYKVCAIHNKQETVLSEPQSAFSPNTLIASPFDDMQALQAYIDEVHSGLEKGSTGQFSSERAALMFLPGDYSKINARVGYYTSVNGLGETPTDVTLGKLYVSAEVLDNQNATCTFWRSVENVEVKSSVTWAVSQATSMRRTKIDESLTLSYGGWASGGFLANSLIKGNVGASTQQQWMSRNSKWKSFSGGSFNMVYAGCEGETHADSWSEATGSHTNLEYTEKIAEKPFLYRYQGGYDVFVPTVQENTKGVTWEGGMAEEVGFDYSLTSFYIADARYDNDVTLNAALAEGKHLLLTPGNYVLDAPLEVTEADTVVLGIGYATLKLSDSNADCAIRVADVDGVRIADILVDAGAYSKNMVVIGEAGSSTSHSENPIVLSNLYIRIGGVANIHTETETALVINANDVIGDNFWIWRADHSQGVAWNDEVNEQGVVTAYGNPAQTGIEVNGDNVRCYALMVEHFEDYQTIWNGENGLTVMYQSETPYRVPTQADWMSHGGTKNGCSSYKVADHVQTHRGIGIGIYLVNYSGVNLASAIEVPEKSGIDMYHLIITNFSGSSGSSISNVINGYGGGVNRNIFRSQVERYPK